MRACGVPSALSNPRRAVPPPWRGAPLARLVIRCSALLLGVPVSFLGRRSALVLNASSAVITSSAAASEATLPLVTAARIALNAIVAALLSCDAAAQSAIENRGFVEPRAIIHT